jgi:hypothetical protein
MRGHTTVASFCVAAALGALVAAGPLGARPVALPAGNLVQNPGGESDVGAANGNSTVTPQAWSTTGTFSAVQYGIPDFFGLDAAFSATIGGGKNFFSGGRNAGVSTATQTIDVAAAATEIDGGGVRATLSAYLGGYASQPDAAAVGAAFLDASDTQLATVAIGPVSAADRKSKTTLLLRSASAAVPKGTRKIRVVLTATRGDGTYNDGYFDNVSLQLAAGSSSPTTTTTTTTATPPPAAAPKLVLACVSHALVATVHPGKGDPIRSVAFVVNGTQVAVDQKAPFTVTMRVTGHVKRLRITARVRTATKTTTLAKTSKRC